MSCLENINKKYNSNRNLSIILLDYIFNSCLALTGIVRVRLIFGGWSRGQFECVWVAQELILVKFFFRLWGNKAILLGIWIDWTLAQPTRVQDLSAVNVTLQSKADRVNRNAYRYSVVTLILCICK